MGGARGVRRHQLSAAWGTIYLTELQQRVSLSSTQLPQPWPPQHSDTVEEKLSVSSCLALVTIKKSLSRPWRWVLSVVSVHQSHSGNPLTSLDKYRIVSNTIKMLAARIETSMWKRKRLEIFMLTWRVLAWITCPWDIHFTYQGFSKQMFSLLVKAVQD